MAKKAIIIGAGPAGLTAALELLRRTGIQPIILEASNEIGGISRTIKYKGYRMDIGGHRFFSKSDRVMQWWVDLMPPDVGDAGSETGNMPEISYQGKKRVVAVPAHLQEEPVLRGIGPIDPHAAEEREAEEPDPQADVLVEVAPHDPDLVMLIRPRKSRIYYLRKFFDYPITLTATTLRNLGVVRTVKVGTRYLKSRVSPIAPEKSLEDFLINRFGRQLYLTFFKSYTEKVWGTPCDQISAEWGAQRIKGLSLTTAILHFVKKAFSSSRNQAIQQKGTETSLIEKFLYPKYGPGQLWEHAADLIRNQGGEILLGWRATRLFVEGDMITAVE